MRYKAVMIAAAGAAAYSISKVDLAFRGELGMPGFPASDASYGTYDPFGGQLFNAVMGLAMVAVIVVLARLPRHRWLRWGLLGINGVAALMIGFGVVSFTARAAGLAPGLGAAATGFGSWVVLAVGAVWVAAWIVAVVNAARASRSGRRRFAAVEAG